MATIAKELIIYQKTKHIEGKLQYLKSLESNKLEGQSTQENSINKIEKIDNISVYPIDSVKESTEYKPKVCLKFKQIGSLSKSPSVEPPVIKIYSKIIEFRRQLLEYYGYELLNRLFVDEVNPYIQIWKCKRLEQDMYSKGFVWMSYTCKMVCFKHDYRRHAFYSLNELLLKDSRLLMQLNHKNVVKVHQIIDLHEPRTTLSFYVCSFMDYSEGCLSDLMDSYPKNIKECEVISKIWFRQIAEAIDYLHNRIESSIRVTHLAISASNIVWQIIDPITNHIVFKLTNFEECIIFKANEPDVCPFVTMVYSQYSAPEALGHCLGKATRPMDIYSLGKLLALHLLKIENRFERFSLFVVQPNAWFSRSERELFKSLSHEVRDLLTDMLWQNPNHRLTAEQVCNHKWLK